MKINDRLVSLKKKAALTVIDLQTWLGFNRETINTWLQGVEPQAHKHVQITEGLDLLDAAIKEGGHFPVPLHINQYSRRSYIEEVRNAVLGRVSSTRSSKRRV